MGKQDERTLDELVEAFQEHLRRTRGMKSEGRHRRARYVRMFIEHVGDDSQVDVTALSTPDVIGFIESLVGRYRPRTIGNIGSALRSFFRFLRVEGLRDDHLDNAVPAVAARRLTGLPRHIDEKQLERFIASLERATPCGRRDRSIVLCVVRLGLRASEVARIRLEDIDWRAAVLNVPSRKTGRGSTLPLLVDVGQAIAEYIENGRPSTQTRQVFVLHQKRVGEPATHQTVRDAVKSALERAGIQAPMLLGTNLLRHTLATRLIRSGASLKEVADLMGHRRLETTQIYAKLDLDSLREVAQPWPGVVS